MYLSSALLLKVLENKYKYIYNLNYLILVDGHILKHKL